MRDRKKSSVAGQAYIENSRKSAHERIKLVGIIPQNKVKIYGCQWVTDISGVTTYSGDNYLDLRRG